MGIQSQLGTFGIDPVSAAADYKGAFSIVNGTLDVTFTAVPEPSATALLLAAGALGVRAWRWLRRERAV